MSNWTFAEIRRVQVALRAVKKCSACKRKLPIQNFYLPTDTTYHGFRQCVECYRAIKSEQQRRGRVA